MSTTKTIFERIASIKEKIAPMSSATFKQKAKDRDPHFNKLESVWYMLEMAGRMLSELPQKMAENPYGAFDDTHKLEYACVVRHLLAPLENFAEGRVDAKTTVEYIHNLAFGRLTDPGELNIHCTSPMRNLLLIYSNHVYCDVLKTLGDAEKSFTADIKSEEEAAFAALEKQNSGGKKAKA